MRWHVCFCDSRRERDACNDIIALGFQAYAPMEKLKRWRRGHRQIVQQPLFPRYIFVEFDANSAGWNEIRYIDGVWDILENNGIPSPLPEGLVGMLMRQERIGLFDHTQRPPLPAGTVVQLDETGPFAEFIGKVLRTRSGDRAEVLIKLLGKEMAVNVPLARLNRI